MTEQERPTVKVTDRRRVQPDGESRPAADPTEEPESTEAAGAPARAKSQETSGEAAVRPESAHTPPESSFPALAQGEGSAETFAELDAAKRQSAEYLEHLQRLKAEFDNYRKRVLKEQTHAVEMASEPLVRRLLDVLDEFDLALMAAEKKPEFEKFLHGVELVYAKLAEILRSAGLERIEAKGKAFDPAEHEALMQSGEGEGEAVVADVLRQGYKMRGRVIRPAGVKVSRG